MNCDTCNKAGFAMQHLVVESEGGVCESVAIPARSIRMVARC